jgi:diadenosine tetraphosphatase ApaH/serine/threonine PP2A family protein phosphatase
VDEALAMVAAGFGWLAGADFMAVPVAERAECLRQLERVRSVQTAVHAALLAAFDHDHGYQDDGQGSARTWLRWQTQLTTRDASDAVTWMRRLRIHPQVAAALRDSRISASWAQQICRWTDLLPASARDDGDAILLGAAAGGAGLADLARLAEELRARLGEPDKDPDGFEDRRLRLVTTLGGAGRLEADLTPQCTEAMRAVLDALGKKAGPEDDRTQEQRDHDALQEACRRLVASGCLPDRAGQPTQIQVHITLEELLRRLSAAERADDAAQAAHGPRDSTGVAGWPAAGCGDECDASLVPVVVGHLDHDLLTQLAARLRREPGACRDSEQATGRERVRDLITANAAALLSGPGGLASWLRTRTLDGAAASVSLPLDTGTPTETIPTQLRRAVILRDRSCRAPGCTQPPAACQIHHLQPRSLGGLTKLSNLALLCSFHHLIAIHQWGWTITLNADGTTTMRNPDGTKVFHSHSPPTGAAA